MKYKARRIDLFTNKPMGAGVIVDIPEKQKKQDLIISVIKALALPMVIFKLNKFNILAHGDGWRIYYDNTYYMELKAE